MLCLQTHPDSGAQARFLLSLKPPSSGQATDAFALRPEAQALRFEDILASYARQDAAEPANLNESELDAIRNDDALARVKSAGETDLEQDDERVEEKAAAAPLPAAELAQAEPFLSAPEMFPPPAPGADDGAIRFELDEPTLDAETVGVQGGGKGGAGLEADLGLRAKNAGKKNAAGTAGAGDAGQAAREEAFRQGGGRSGASAGTPVGAADAAASADTSEAGGGEAATADAPAEVAAASAAGARQRTAAGSARAETANVSAAAEAALAQQHAGKLAEGQISARGGRHTSQGNLAGGERGSQSAAARAKTRAASGEQTAPDGGGTGVSGVRQIDLTVNTLANANAVSGDGAANGNGTAAITEIAHHAGTTGGAGAENGAGERLSNMLAHELRTSLNSDIVRHASVLMRDGGDGLIRLSLKPESLGNVKIRLQMAENKISGEIIVETKEALKAFEQQIHELEKAFQAQGYDAAHLEMSLANDSGQGQLAGGDAPEFSSGKAAERYERSGEITRADALAAYFFPERELDMFA